MPSTIRNEEPWRACYEELAPKLLLFARQWLASRADAEDAVQAGFVRFWKSNSAATRQHYPLLFAAVRSAAQDLIRKDQRRMARERTYQTENEAPYFVCEANNSEELALIQSALERLPTEQRETVVLRIWAGLTFAEIATAVNASINTVAARHRYAIQSLRKILQTEKNERLRV